jgi:hypothetical protein
VPPVCPTAGVPQQREARIGAETVSVEPAETSRFSRGKTLSGRRMLIEHWEMIAGQGCWVEPGSRAVGCERGAPLRSSVHMSGD